MISGSWRDGADDGPGAEHAGRRLRDDELRAVVAGVEERHIERGDAGREVQARLTVRKDRRHEFGRIRRVDAGDRDVLRILIRRDGIVVACLAR